MDFDFTDPTRLPAIFNENSFLKHHHINDEKVLSKSILLARAKYTSVIQSIINLVTQYSEE